MRVSFAALVAGSAFLLGACSDGGENILRRQSSVAPERTPATNTSKGGDDNAKPTPDPAPPSNTPAPSTAPPAPDAGAPATPKPAPTPGSCGAPKCFAAGGYAGCKGTGAAGDVATMGCQDGACACFAGHQTTATFDGAPASATEASQLFLANCDCQ